MHSYYKQAKMPVYDDYLITCSNLLTMEAPIDNQQVKTHRKRSSCIEAHQKYNPNAAKVIKSSSNLYYSSKNKNCKSLVSERQSNLRSNPKNTVQIPNSKKSNIYTSSAKKSVNSHASNIKSRKSKNMSTLSTDRNKNASLSKYYISKTNNNFTRSDTKINSTKQLIKRTEGNKNYLKLNQLYFRCTNMLNQYQKINHKLTRQNEELRKQNQQLKSAFN